jgi:hypothetical protein
VDSRAQDALETLVRRIVCSNFDELAGEIERLRREVISLEKMVGLSGHTPGRWQRQARVAELRGRGYSTRAIAQLLHIDRSTVTKDCARLGLEPAEFVIGLDGRTVRGPRPSTAASGGNATA